MLTQAFPMVTFPSKLGWQAKDLSPTKKKTAQRLMIMGDIWIMASIWFTVGPGGSWTHLGHFLQFLACDWMSQAERCLMVLMVLMLTLWPGGETKALPARSTVEIAKLSFKIKAEIKMFQKIYMNKTNSWPLCYAAKDNYRNPTHRGRRKTITRTRAHEIIHSLNAWTIKTRKQLNMPSSVN